MFNANDFLAPKSNDSINYSRQAFTNKVVEIIKEIMQNKDNFHQELQSLKERSKTSPNEVFPVKIKNIVDLCNAAETLYEWYVLKAKKN